MTIPTSRQHQAEAEAREAEAQRNKTGDANPNANPPTGTKTTVESDSDRLTRLEEWAATQSSWNHNPEAEHRNQGSPDEATNE